MRLSTRSTYGMRALAEIALSSGRGPASAALIAKRQGLSVAYLEQLLHRLKRHGLVKSVRGPRGGYQLARDPARITMADVVRVLDGSAGLGNGRTRELPRRVAPIAQALRSCVHERLAQTLAQVTLRDVCAEASAVAGAPLEHRYVFHI